VSPLHPGRRRGSSSFGRRADSGPESTFSHSLARAKSDEGGDLANLADIDSTTLEQGNGSILASKPGSILASAEGLRGKCLIPMRKWPVILVTGGSLARIAKKPVLSQ
jgi:hypothetical protein